MNCEWKDSEARPLVCKHCGRACNACNGDATAKRKCTTGKGPSPVRRLANFAVAAVKHELRGRPTVDQAMIDARLAICQACPFFRGDRRVCGHRKCGCNVGNAQTYLNKLAWADQKCPDGRWPAINRAHQGMIDH